VSDDFLRLIPTNPEYVPDSTAQAIVRQMVALFLPQAQEINVLTADEVQFVDQGANFERVLCPACGVKLEMDWWQGVMEKAYEKHFLDLSVKLPCCGAAASLNDLTYEWPAGFARFMVEAVNPQADLTDQQIEALEEWARCSFRKIWAHY
jgi:hypothetical protein